MPAGLGVAVPVAAPTPAVDSIRLKVGMLTPHAVPSQVAVPVVGTGHAVHELPQVKTLLFAAQLLPHAWKPVAH